MKPLHFLPRGLGLFALCLLASASFIPHPPSLPTHVAQYCQRYRYLSIELHHQTNIPIPIILAVAGLESGWGTSDLAVYANNHFGIKNKEDWQGWTYCKETWEYWDGVNAVRSEECFRKYALIRESYQDFGRFLQSRHYYPQLSRYAQDDYRSWTEALQWGSYATDPAYAEKLQRLIWEYRLDEVATEYR